MSEWQQYDGDYEKTWYDVMTEDGTIHKYCWPNAGIMNAVHSGGHKFTEVDNIKIRKSSCHPLQDQDYWH